MRSLLCLLTLALAGPALADIDVSLTPREGPPIDARLLVPELVVIASFGKATIAADHLASIDFGQGGAADTFVTDDGTQLKGRLEGDLTKILVAPGKEAALVHDALASLTVMSRAELKAGTITSGVARNRVSYYLRAPEGYTAPAAPGEGPSLPAILILHGSNMNSRAYVNTIASAWPDIAKRYILIGINGENRNPNSSGKDPAYNYTYVNFVGKSKYQGYPGTDRESPALVSEVLQELQTRLPIGKVFVGGHSQGGFLTYSLMMNYPDLFAGAFPISAGLIFQCEPTAYEDQALIAKQKRVPLAIVHATNDGVVGFDAGRYAWEVFEDANFPMLALVKDDAAAHMFARLPVDDAIAWLEKMTSDDPKVLLGAAEEWLKQERYRDADAALNRVEEMKLDDVVLKVRREKLIAALEAKSVEQAKTVLAAMDADKESGAWVEAFLVYRAQFANTEGAQEAMKRYRALRTKQQELADDLFGKARQAFGSGDAKTARELAARIVKECYASDKYRLAKGWLKDE